MNTRLNFKGVPFLLLCTVAAWSVGAGCNCNPDLRPDGGLDGSVEEDGGGTDSGTPDAGPDPVRDGGELITTDGGGQCVVNGAVCTPDGDPACCSGYCNGTTCQAAIFCAPAAAACTANTQCCTGSCVSGECTEDRCNNLGQQCSIGADCCSGTCSTGVCAQISGSSCLATGSACTAGGTACCSQNCRSGICERAATCNTTGDVCYSNGDCCSLLCSGTGGNAGVCTTGTGLCDQAGTPCDSFGTCCSRVCADPGSGRKVCQAVSGCRPAGDSCTSDLGCCGGKPNGTVDCDNAGSFCDNGQACRAPGTICGKPTEADGGCARNQDGSCFEVNNETNCCEGVKIGPRDLTCKVDEVGVPRCFGGGDPGTCPTGYTGVAGCCIAVGEICNFSDQCCNGSPCVPDAVGVRRCTVSTCIGLGNECQPATDGGNSGCCSGTCLPTSEITYACQLSGTGTDGGGCQANTEVCTASSQCCSGICEGGTCKAPDSCQPADQVCSADGDCCSGLSCNIPSGQTTGTCKTGSTCPGAGQNCSPTSLCCGEGTSLQCLNPSGFNCDGTTSCACEFIITKPGSPQPE
ncbi:MAG: hypothetical protein M3Y59_11840 [Myxococcota bacterium]|nr:hypothetical protein [Myxococcota bacterium]